MLIDKNNNPLQSGSIEVICGCMFAGKTKELIRRINNSGIAEHKIGVFKPSIDVRYDSEKIVSHDAHYLEAIPLNGALNILDHVDEIDLVAIDEAQFFGDDLVETVKKMSVDGKRVILAGLDNDYLGNPFGPMPALMSISNNVTTLHAVCERCGGEASFTYRKTQSVEQIVLGEKNEYEARCKSCYDAK